MKQLTISLGIFLVVIGLISLVGMLVIAEPGQEGRLQAVATASKLFLYRHAIVNTLSEQEAKQLYQSACTRKCHSKDVVESSPRTAVEWEWIVARMGIAERADLNSQKAQGITAYLQRHFLSNVPTILPEQTMAFLRRYLWKSDFGEDDIYFDLIYIPPVHSALIPYLVAADTDLQRDQGALFILYINTHQGIVPPWDMADIATIRGSDGDALQATNWQVIYDDGQLHHRQGLLSFPVSGAQSRAIDVEIDLPGMKSRYFHWDLPIPDFDHSDTLEAKTDA